MHLKKYALAAGVFLLSAGTAAAATLTAGLNLRAGPGTRYGVIDTMPAGAQVSVLNCGAYWCRVDWRGEEGYASSRYISGSGYASNGYYASPGYSYGYGYPDAYDYPDDYGYYGPVVGFGFGYGGYYGHHRYRHHHHHYVYSGHHHYRHHYAGVMSHTVTHQNTVGFSRGTAGTVGVGHPHHSFSQGGIGGGGMGGHHHH
jgi:Bacterial SH3 domain